MSGPQLIPKGEYIFREGETARYAYVLQTGVVDIVKIGSEGEKVLFELEVPVLRQKQTLLSASWMDRSF
jgi:CRP-like cAMP-binding protein